jgi:hypothetical protein
MIASPKSGHFYFAYLGHYHFGVTEKTTCIAFLICGMVNL